MIKILLIALLALFTSLWGSTEIQPRQSPYEKIQLESLSLDQGLSESEVGAILQDRHGFMWFGTSNGLNRFDGYDIKVFSHDPQDPHSISHNVVYFLHQDQSGKIWMGTANGPNRYDPATGIFTRLLPDPKDPHSISHLYINSYLEDSEGTLWFGTANGLNRFDKQNESFTRFTHQPDNPHSLSSKIIITQHQDKLGTLWVGTQNGLNRLDRKNPADNSFTRFLYDGAAENATTLLDNSTLLIWEDQTGTIWIGTPGGLYRYNRKKESFMHFTHTPGNPESLSDNYIRQLVEDGNGSIWVATTKGLNRFNKNTATFTRFLEAPAGSDEEHSSITPYTYEDKKGRLWVGTMDRLNQFDTQSGQFKSFIHGFNDMEGRDVVSILKIQEDRLGGLWLELQNAGLCRFDPETGTFTRFMSDSNAPLSFPRNSPRMPMMEDGSGVFWVGTFGGGVKKFDPWKQQFIHIRRDPLNENSLSNNMVYSICEDREGGVWMGTYGDGVDRVDPKSGVFFHYRHDPEHPRTLSNNKVGAIKEDGNGVIWVGTVWGLNRFNAKTGDFTPFLNNPEDPHSLSGNHVTTLAEDRQGNLWVGTESGLNCFRPHSGDFIRYLPSQEDMSSISSGNIRAIYSDSQGNLWVGTMNGLNKLDGQTHLFTRFQNRPGDPSSLSDNYVYAIFEDKEGILWLGTGGGLNRFDPHSNQPSGHPGQEGRFRSWRKKDGLPNDNIYGILGDSAGNLWLSALMLSKFNPTTGAFTNYDVYNGKQKNYFAEGAYTKGKSGRFYFGGLNGVTFFYPHNVNPNPHAPPVVFTDFLVFNRSLTPGKREKDLPFLAKTITETGQIELSYKHNFFSLEFAALHYCRPHMNRYAYKMEGYDENWLYSGTRRFVTYTNLAAGNYVFRVKAANSDNVWNETGAALKIRITPPWWLTSWAYVFYLMVVVAVIFAAFSWQRWRVEKKERHKASLMEVELRAKAAEAEANMVRAESVRKTHELEEARKLQLSMLPDVLPDTADFEIAVHMNTATEVGGDYYDFHLAEDGMLSVLVGDATGHGLKAGTMVSIVKALFTARASNQEITDFFKNLANTIKNMHLGNLHMALLFLKIKDNAMTVSSAGMPPVLIYRPATKEIKKIEIKRPPLGAMKNIDYPCERLTLDRGDTLLLLSDGLAESFNPQGEMFGYSRVEFCFQEVVEKEPAQIIAHLVDVGAEWRGGVPLEDDITFVVIKVLKDLAAKIIN